MKKKLLLFSCCILLAAVNATADDGQKIDASKVKQITFRGNEVTIKYNDGTPDQTVDMETVTIDFSNVTGIDERIAISKKEGLEGKPVYNLKGQLVGNSVARLPKGIYIIGGKKLIIK